MKMILHTIKTDKKIACQTTGIYVISSASVELGLARQGDKNIWNEIWEQVYLTTVIPLLTELCKDP